MRDADDNGDPHAPSTSPGLTAVPGGAAALEPEFALSVADTPEMRAMKLRLVELREEHRAMDAAIAALAAQGSADALQLARLKKRKLALRDEIQWIEDRITPDIIA